MESTYGGSGQYPSRYHTLPNKIPSNRNGLYIFWIVDPWVPIDPLHTHKLHFIVNAVGYTVQLDSETVLLKILHTWIRKYGKNRAGSQLEAAFLLDSFHSSE